MKKITFKKVAAALLVLVLGLVAGDITLREESDVMATVQKVKAKVEALLEEETPATSETLETPEAAPAPVPTKDL